VSAARTRGHDVRVVDPVRCYMNISSFKPSIHHDGKILPPFDAIIPRIGASITVYGTAIVRQFEMMGVFALNESIAISHSRDKLQLLQLLSQEGIPLPATGFANFPTDKEDLLKIVGGAPVILRPLEGKLGEDVVLAETHEAAESVVEAFRGLNTNFIVQQVLKDTGGRCWHEAASTEGRI